MGLLGQAEVSDTDVDRERPEVLCRDAAVNVIQ